jgi:hypothetical protein
MIEATHWCPECEQWRDAQVSCPACNIPLVSRSVYLKIAGQERLGIFDMLGGDIYNRGRNPPSFKEIFQHIQILEDREMVCLVLRLMNCLRLVQQGNNDPASIAFGSFHWSSNELRNEVHALLDAMVQGQKVREE